MWEMSWRRKATSYTSLPSESDDGPQEKAQADYPSKASEPTSSFFSLRIFVPILICVLCSSVNLYALYKAGERDIYSVTRDDIPNLRRPSQFIGLDKVKSPTSIIPRHLVNYPMVLAPIDHNERGKVFPQDPKAFKAIQGLSTAEERRFLVSDTMSTIAQFRVLDYGMESCELTITYPSPEDPKVSPTAEAALGQGSHVIDIYTLSATKPILPHKLSYSTRPNRSKKIATMEIALNTTFNYLFPCQSDSLQTFEFVAGQQGAHVEWWQNKEGGLPSLIMNQYATV